MSNNSETLRKSTLATLGEIVEGEARLKAAGVDATELDDWMMLRDIVARIERRARKEAAE